MGDKTDENDEIASEPVSEPVTEKAKEPEKKEEQHDSSAGSSGQSEQAKAQEVIENKPIESKLVTPANVGVPAAAKSPVGNGLTFRPKQGPTFLRRLRRPPIDVQS